MFFTIIIPAYNCEKTINRLMESIKDQDTDDIKVIVVDDSRGEGHQNLGELVKPYKEFFAVDYYKREDKPYTIHCPGNTRHSGLNKALQEDTEYILFIDNDDQFVPQTFGKIKQLLIDGGMPPVVGSRFDVFNADGTYAYKEFNSLGWLHGKLYRKDFLVEHNIQFKIDMAAHEDTYFNCLLTYHQILNRVNPTNMSDNFCFYIWFRQPTSITHGGYENPKNDLFIQDHFEDYCSSCIGVFLENYKYSGNIDPEIRHQFALRVAHSVYMAYCYFQGFIDKGHLDRLQKCYDVLRRNLWDYYKLFNSTKEDLIKIVYADPQLFINHRNISYIGVGHYIERESFQDFINNMKFYG